MIDAALADGEEDVAELLKRLLVEEPQQVPIGTDPVTSVVAQLVRHATRRVLTEREVAVRSGELAARDVVDEISVAKELLDHLEGPRAPRPSASSSSGSSPRRRARVPR